MNHIRILALAGTALWGVDAAMTRIRMVDSAAPTTSIVSPSITAVTTYGAEVSVVGAGALLEVDGRGGCCLTSSLG